MTRNEFVERANKIHNGKYNYNKVEYKNRDEKVCINCPIHGDFYQTPKNHMNGQGCPKCGAEYAKNFRKGDYETFIKKAFELYGDDFSFPSIETKYINSKTPILIKCNKCGFEFTKRPNDFLNNKVFKGCKQCRKKMSERKKIKREITNIERKTKQPKKTKEIFLKTFKEKFGDTLTPFIDEYYNTQKSIHFKCNVCGYVFKRTPNNCLKSNGCPNCHDPKNVKLLTEDFINRANVIHQNKYDYSETEYKTTDIKVKVICHEKDEFGEEHGPFWVTPHAHIGKMKSGCPKCSGKFRKDTDYFIKQAELVHGKTYIYDETEYKRALDKVKIICKIHGAFWQTPNQHLSGKGCPLCKESKLEREIRMFLEENNIKFTPQATFDWLRTDDIHKKMSLDFYIPENKIGIECQGEQHFIDDLGKKTLFSIDTLKRIKIRDKMKKHLCEEHGIKLLYYSNLGIKYPYEVIEDKEQLLKEIKNNEQH